MSPITRTATPAAVVLLLAAVAPARAERAPDDRCAAATLRASGRLANCLLQSDAGFVVSDKAERYEKNVGRCEDGFARRHRQIIGRHVRPTARTTLRTSWATSSYARPRW
jgi:hypothetical protein